MLRGGQRWSLAGLPARSGSARIAARVPRTPLRCPRVPGNQRARRVVAVLAPDKATAAPSDDEDPGLLDVQLPSEQQTPRRGEIRVEDLAPEHWRTHLDKLKPGEQRSLRRYIGVVARINALRQTMAQLSDEQLAAKTGELRRQLLDFERQQQQAGRGGGGEGSPFASVGVGTAAGSLSIGREFWDVSSVSSSSSTTAAERRRDVRRRESGPGMLGGMPEGVVVEAFAVVREAAQRVLGMRHYDVQMLGGLALHEGRVAEMATGEGKTLVATLPAYVNALTGKGVHVVTVNDYLAKRDAEWIGKVFTFLGLSVGVVTNESSLAEKQAALAKDITYITAYDLVFTYLSDYTINDPSEVCLRRPLHFALIDEVDSILIDEAVNPMLLTLVSPNSNALTKARWLAAIEMSKDLDVEVTREQSTEEEEAKRLAEECDAVVNPRYYQALLTARGMENSVRRLVKEGLVALAKDEHGRLAVAMLTEAEGKTEVDLAVSWAGTAGSETRPFHTARLAGRGELAAEVEEKLGLALLREPSREELAAAVPLALWGDDNAWGAMLTVCLQAHHCYKRDINYLVRDGKVVIIDLPTGRERAKSVWQAGVHQAVEAKEGVPMREEPATSATVSYQAFFSYYPRLAGMTGTAATEEMEFEEAYGLSVVRVPPHRPSQRVDHPAAMYFYWQGGYARVRQLLKEAVEQGRPVLIGTGSVQESTNVMEAVVKRFLHKTRSVGKYAVSLLNADPNNTRFEAAIIAQAGLPSAITVSTNVAGRGTDILLGGNPKGLVQMQLEHKLLDLMAPGAPDKSAFFPERIPSNVFPAFLSEHNMQQDLPAPVFEAYRELKRRLLALLPQEQRVQVAARRAAEQVAPLLQVVGSALEFADARVLWLDKQLYGSSSAADSPPEQRAALAEAEFAVRRLAALERAVAVAATAAQALLASAPGQAAPPVPEAQQLPERAASQQAAAADGKPTAADGQPAALGQQAAGEHAAGGQAADVQAAGEQAADGQTANAQAAGEQAAGGQAAGGAGPSSQHAARLQEALEAAAAVQRAAEAARRAAENTREAAAQARQQSTARGFSQQANDTAVFSNLDAICFFAGGAAKAAQPVVTELEAALREQEQQAALAGLQQPGAQQKGGQQQGNVPPLPWRGKRAGGGKHAAREVVAWLGQQLEAAETQKAHLRLRECLNFGNNWVEAAQERIHEGRQQRQQKEQGRQQAAQQNGAGSAGAAGEGDAVRGVEEALQTFILLQWLWFDMQCSEYAKEVKSAGGLRVILASLPENTRSELQLRGRSGRQGDRGDTHMVLSLDDSLLKGMVAGATAIAQGAYEKINRRTREQMEAGLDAEYRRKNPRWSLVYQGLLEAPVEEGSLWSTKRQIKSVVGSVEGKMRQARNAMRQCDEAVDAYRQQVYRLRTVLVKGGSADRQSMLHSFYQDLAFEMVAALVDPARPPSDWERGLQVLMVRLFALVNQAGDRKQIPWQPGLPWIAWLDGQIDAVGTAVDFDPRQYAQQLLDALDGGGDLPAPPLVQPADWSASKALPGKDLVWARMLEDRPYRQALAVQQRLTERQAAAAGRQQMQLKAYAEPRLGLRDRSLLASLRAEAAAYQPPPPAAAASSSFGGTVGGGGGEPDTASSQGPRLEGRYAPQARLLAAWVAEFLALQHRNKREALKFWLRLPTDGAPAGCSAVAAEGTVSLCERDFLVVLLDQLWMGFIEDVERTRRISSARSFSAFDPLLEFQLETRATFARLLQDFRQLAAVGSFSRVSRTQLLAAGRELSRGPQPAAEQQQQQGATDGSSSGGGKGGAGLPTADGFRARQEMEAMDLAILLDSPAGQRLGKRIQADARAAAAARLVTPAGMHDQLQQHKGKLTRSAEDVVAIADKQYEAVLAAARQLLAAGGGGGELPEVAVAALRAAEADAREIFSQFIKLANDPAFRMAVARRRFGEAADAATAALNAGDGPARAAALARLATELAVGKQAADDAYGWSVRAQMQADKVAASLQEMRAAAEAAGLQLPPAVDSSSSGEAGSISSNPAVDALLGVDVEAALGELGEQSRAAGARVGQAERRPEQQQQQQQLAGLPRLVEGATPADVAMAGVLQAMFESAPASQFGQPQPPAGGAPQAERQPGSGGGPVADTPSVVGRLASGAAVLLPPGYKRPLPESARRLQSSAAIEDALAILKERQQPEEEPPGGEQQQEQQGGEQGAAEPGAAANGSGPNGASSSHSSGDSQERNWEEWRG